MSRKPKPSKTTNPLHFEDLDPRRFEDLVRRLLYGFREWTSIEPTGRGGADDGFDARAWEQGASVANVDEDGEEGTHPLDGRVWQIQCKREKSITPAKMRTIIQEGVSSDDPPYGYILAAATNISKATYDAFREELRAKRVAEFYFWGKDHLEDQLSLPVNDEILFTFFGYSLAARRRSRTTELKFEINNKNKILRILCGSDKINHNQGVPRGTRFLLRDINADPYPREDAYPDFDSNPRWMEHDVVQLTARGLLFEIRERFAYLDLDSKEWDATRAVDLSQPPDRVDQERQARRYAEKQKVERYWKHLPRRVQAKLFVYGYIPFDEILLIDDRGDTEHPEPHLYVDFGTGDPFKRTIANLLHRGQRVGEETFSSFTRVSRFPDSFPDIAVGNLHELGTLGIPADVSKELGYLRGDTTIFAVGGPLAQLGVGDLIHVPGQEGRGSDGHAEVTHVYKTTVDDVIATHGEHQAARLNAMAGRELKGSDEVLALELHSVYYFGNGRVPSYLDPPGW